MDKKLINRILDSFIFFIILASLWLDIVMVQDFYKMDSSYYSKYEDFYLDETILVQENLYAEPEINEYRIKICLDSFNSLPEWIKEEFKAADWKIILKNKLKSEEVEGITIYGSKIIALDVDTVSIKDTLYHEIGHFIDSKDSMYSKSSTYQDLYSIYKDTYSKYIFSTSDYCIDNTDYAISTIQEFFASTFADYLINPESLKENTPLLFDYYEKIIKKA